MKTPLWLNLSQHGLLTLVFAGMLVFQAGSLAMAKTPLESWRETLFQQYWTRQIPFETMMTRARQLNEKLRGPLMRRLNVQDAGYHRKAGQENMPVRTGSTPGVFPGRGIYSDEDLQCITWTCIENVHRESKHLGYTVEAHTFRLFIPALDVKVWKPEERLPAFANGPAYHQYARDIALDPEYALGARYGVANVRTPLESVLENLTKGQQALGTEPRSWPKGYHRYEELIQMAKNTVKSMEATGLCKVEGENCRFLNDLRKMKQSPEALGLFKPGANEANVLKVLNQQQDRMRHWMRHAMVEAEAQMDRDVTVLVTQLASDKIPKNRQAVIEKAREIQTALYRSAVRMDVLAQRHPALLFALNGGETPYRFICRQQARIESLERAISLE